MGVAGQQPAADGTTPAAAAGSGNGTTGMSLGGLY
jgi:hypothetical protein